MRKGRVIEINFNAQGRFGVFWEMEGHIRMACEFMIPIDVVDIR